MKLFSNKAVINQPLVSVIIPAYNAERYIDEALHSIFGQTYPKIEIIVVDDGSSDRTGEILASYQPRVKCITQRNGGGYPGSPRNTGLNHCQGDFICFLDADDIMRSTRVEMQVNFLLEHPQVGVVFTDYQNFSDSGAFEKTHFQTCPSLWDRLRDHLDLALDSATATALLIQENIGLPSSMMIRRKVLGVVPRFSTAFQIGEDFHFYYRIARVFSVGVINRVGADRRVHNNNITRNAIRVLHNCAKSRADLWKTESNRENLKLLNEYLFLSEINLAYAYANQRNIRQSLGHNFRALTIFSCKNLKNVFLSLRAMLRTAAIAVHIKAPST